MARSQQSPRIGAAAALSAAVTAGFALWIGLDLGGHATTRWVDRTAVSLAALAACGACFHARARHWRRLRGFWTLLALALASFTLAELTLAFYALRATQRVPSPSVADIGYLAAVPLAVAALLAHPATKANRARKARALVDGTLLATALLFLAWTLVLEPLWRRADLSTMGGIVTLARPFGDVVVVFCIVLAIRGMTGASRLSLWCLFAALLAMALTDIGSAYVNEIAHHSGSGARLIDTGWLAAYLGVCLAGYSSRPESRARLGTELSQPSLAALATPLIVVLVALTIVSVRVRLGHHLDRAAWLMALALVALALARQAMLLRELFAHGSATRAELLASVRRAALGHGAGQRADAAPYGTSRHGSA